MGAAFPREHADLGGVSQPLLRQGRILSGGYENVNLRGDCQHRQGGCGPAVRQRIKPEWTSREGAVRFRIRPLTAGLL